MQVQISKNMEIYDSQPTKYALQPRPSSTRSEKGKNSVENALFLNLIRWCTLVFTSISVEPVVFLHILANSISGAVSSNMMKDRICSQYFNYSDKQCAAYGSGLNKTVDLTVQEEWVVFDMYSTLVHTIPAVLISLALGSWSDLFGRRMPMITSYIGLILSLAISLVLFSYPSLPLWMLFIPTFVSTISGGLFASLLAYIADISDTASARTLRITTMDIARALAGTAGGYISSVIMTSKSLPNGFNYWLILGFAFVGLVYVMIFIETTRSPLPPTIGGKSLTTKSTSVWQTILARDRIQLITESFRCAFKRGERHTRTVLWIFIGIQTISVFSNSFERNFMMPFLTGAPLYWTIAYNAKVNSYFGIPNLTVLGVGTYFLRRVLKVDDVALMLIGNISQMASNFIISITRKTYMMYISHVVGLPGSMTMIGFRSLLSGLVPRNEQGKVHSCTSALESAVPLLGAVAASKVFAGSVKWWPGLFAAITAGLEGISLVLLVIADRFMLADKVAVRKDELESYGNIAAAGRTANREPDDA